MKKDEFLSELKKNLRGMPDTDKQDALNDYEEHFRVGMADGRSEEEIAQSLGNPRAIGNAFRIDAMLDEPKEDGSTSGASVLRAVFASISLTFLNLVFVVAPFFIFLVVLGILWGIAGTLVVDGVLISLSPFVVPDVLDLTGYFDSPFWRCIFMLFGGIGIGALGYLACIGMIVLSDSFFKGVSQYVKFNIRIISGMK